VDFDSITRILTVIAPAGQHGVKNAKSAKDIHRTLRCNAWPLHFIPFKSHIRPERFEFFTVAGLKSFVFFRIPPLPGDSAVIRCIPVRFPRLRFTVKQIMVAVVLWGLAFAGFRVWRWRIYCLRTAALHRASAASCSDGADFLEMLRNDADEKVRCGDLSWRESAANQRREAELTRRWSAYWKQLQRKYEAAAAHPWLPIEPDPPLRLPDLLEPESMKGVGRQ
jgi:hypothetical protein